MVKLSKEALARLKGQRSGMSRGVIIDNKKFTKMLLRALPTYGALPGHEYVGIFCKVTNDGTTSPRTFGMECPVLDLFDRMVNDDSTKSAAYDTINLQREYWMAVADPNDLGTVDSPNVRILKAKQSVYSEILDAMTDEDDGCDITDPNEGCHMRVRKSGSGKNTEWKSRILQEQKPICEDEELTQAFVDAAEAFSVSARFYSVDLEKLIEIYDVLSGGEEIPEKYMKQLRKSKHVKKKGDDDRRGRDNDDDDDDDDDDDGGAEEASEDETEDEDEDEDEEESEDETEEGDGESEVIPKGTAVSFEFEDGAYTGEVTGSDNDDDGDFYYEITVDGEVWSIFPETTEITVIEEEPEEEEPEEVSPTKPPKKSKKPKTAKKVAPKKTAAPKEKDKPKLEGKKKLKGKKKAAKKKPSAAKAIRKKRKGKK